MYRFSTYLFSTNYLTIFRKNLTKNYIFYKNYTEERSEEVDCKTVFDRNYSQTVMLIVQIKCFLMFVIKIAGKKFNCFKNIHIFFIKYEKN